jgi:transmembrane sensor
MSRNNPIGKCQQDAVAWLVRLRPGAATAKDVAAFKDWCRQTPANAKAFTEMRRLWTELGPAGQSAFDPRAFEKLVASRAAPPVLVGRRAFLGGAVAAGAAAAATYAAIYPPLNLWPSLSAWNADYRTATGEQRQIKLANDNSIELNTQSAIALRSTENDGDRIELIAGEGVAKSQSRALEVVAANGQVRAIHATFNIRRDDYKVSVTCLQGQIEVACHSELIKLTSSQQVDYSDAGLGPVLATDPAIVTSWREGFLIFHDARLIDVIAEINRYRRGRLVVASSDLAQRVVNGRFYLAHLDDVVEKFQNAFGARATVLPAGVVILS